MANPVWVTQSGSVGLWGAGTPFSFQFIANKTTGWTVGYSLLSGTLPTGMTLSSTGLLSGIPESYDSFTTYSFTIRASSLTRSGAVVDQSDRDFSVTVQTWSEPASGSQGLFTGGTPIHPITFVAGAGYDGDILYKLAPGYQYPTGNFTLTQTVNDNGITVAILTGTPNTVSDSTTTLFNIAVIKKILVDSKPVNIEVQRGFTMTVMPYTIPQWVTPQGNIGNYVENTSFSYQFQANAMVNGDIVTYSLLNGSYPIGNLTLQSSANVATLIGTLGEVSANTVSEFTVRATEKNGTTVVGVSDRTFNMTVSGATAPGFKTTPGILSDMRGLPYATTPAAPITKIEVGAGNLINLNISPYNITNYGITNNTAVYISGVEGMTELNNNLYYIANADPANSSMTLYLNPGVSGAPANPANGATYSNYTGGGSIARVTNDSVYFETQILANLVDPNTTAVFSLAGGSLPDGLELAANGLISGYPTGKRLVELPDGAGYEYVGAVDVYGQPIIKLSEFQVKVTSESGSNIANYAIGISNQEAVWNFGKTLNAANYGNFPGRPPAILNNQPLTQVISKSDPYYSYYISGNTIGTFDQNNQLIYKMIGYNFNATEQEGNTYGLEYTITGLRAGTPSASNAFTTGELISPLPSNNSANGGWINGTLANIGTDINTYTFNVNVTAPNLAGNVFTSATFSSSNTRVLVGEASQLRTTQEISFIGDNVGNISNANSYYITSISPTVTTTANITSGSGTDPNIVVGSLLAINTNTPVKFIGDSTANIISNTTYYVTTSSQTINYPAVTTSIGSNLINVSSRFGNTYGISNSTPVMFDTSSANILSNTVYYARLIAGDTSNIKIRLSPTSGAYIIADTNSTMNMYADSPMLTIAATVGGANIIPDADSNMIMSTNSNCITISSTVNGSDITANATGNMVLHTQDFLPLSGGNSTFSLIVAGDISAGIGWSSDGDLGTITNGSISDKSVKAVFGSDGVSTTVTLTAGSSDIAAQSIRALANNQPITFTGNSVGNISNSMVYFINGEINTTNSTFKIRNQYEQTNSMIPNVSGTMTLHSTTDDGKFRIISGSLPPSLQLLSTGDIAGRLAFENTATQQAANTRQTYTFTVQAYSSQYQEITKEKTFTLTTVQKYTDPYDNLYVKGLLNVGQRTMVDDLLAYIDETQNNTLTKNIYRPSDPNFGVATGVKYGHMYGVDSKTSSVFMQAYVEAIKKNHYYKDLTLGSLRTAVARDDTGAIIYEVVYSPIIDNLVNQQGISISKEVGWVYPIIIDGIQQSSDLYPNSIPDMQAQIKATIGQINDDSVLPKWMRSQQVDGNVPGFVPCWVLCYTQPGTSTTVMNSINSYLTENRMSLNSINFAMDRFEVDRALTYTYGSSGNQYWPTFTAGLTANNSIITLNTTSGLSLNQQVQFTGNTTGTISNIANYWISELDTTANTVKIRNSYYTSTVTPTAIVPSITGNMTMTVTPLSASVADDSQDSYVYFTQKTILQ